MRNLVPDPETITQEFNREFAAMLKAVRRTRRRRRARRRLGAQRDLRRAEAKRRHTGDSRRVARVSDPDLRRLNFRIQRPATRLKVTRASAMAVSSALGASVALKVSVMRENALPLAVRLRSVANAGIGRHGCSRSAAAPAAPCLVRGAAT